MLLTRFTCIFLTKAVNISKFFCFIKSSDKRRYVTPYIFSLGRPNLEIPFGLAF